VPLGRELGRRSLGGSGGGGAEAPLHPLREEGGDDSRQHVSGARGRQPGIPEI
jgi:hypothetical protein